MVDPILKTIPTLSSLALVSYNINHLKKKKKKSTDLIEQGVGNIVGVTMTKEIANFIGE